MTFRHGAIPTVYRGIQFRSRLEAKWAAFFDECRFTWKYEPYDLPGWIPDFEVDWGKSVTLVEIKPARSVDEIDAVFNTDQLRSAPDGTIVIGACPVPMSDGRFVIGRQMHLDPAYDVPEEYKEIVWPVYNLIGDRLDYADARRLVEPILVALGCQKVGEKSVHDWGVKPPHGAWERACNLVQWKRSA